MPDPVEPAGGVSRSGPRPGHGFVPVTGASDFVRLGPRVRPVWGVNGS